MTVSIKDVAEKAGCSTATVSRVLSGKGYISPDSREKVMAAVEALGYRPNRLARSLREQKSRVIGLILSDIRNPFFSEISRAVEAVAMEAGYSVVICNTDEDPKKEARYLQLMADEKVAGILLSPTRAGFKQALDGGMGFPPIVLFDRKLPDSGLDSVVLDNFDSAQKLTRTLLDGGYRRIAGLFGLRSYTAMERMRGFHAAFEGTGLEPAAALQAPAFEAEGERMIDELLKLEPRIDAVLCGSALLASGAFKRLRQRGIRVPAEIGFAAFDDPTWASFVEPPVTVIRQPAATIGQAGAELLMKRIEDPARPVSEVCLLGELVERASSRKEA
ncbi:LacI family DNA-binding transcriptional regulator [Luteolibacter sp. LG18]|uniref:LacI family DNA-binding transcriptional regulator n=1 Tax=Luteolibacter sp. LG18 TaxID=2819286 RepID=UPI002B2F0DC1|nr:LacI family transcriptional regulator [Luteolibacter sp. LG18]